MFNLVGNNPLPKGIKISEILLFVQRLFVLLSVRNSIASSHVHQQLEKKRGERVAYQFGTAQTSSQEAPPCGAPTPGLYSKGNHPLVVLGDFNEILYPSEKEGGMARPLGMMREFRECLMDCGLEDLGYKGDLFTWKRGEIRERVNVLIERSVI